MKPCMVAIIPLIVGEIMVAISALDRALRMQFAIVAIQNATKFDHDKCHLQCIHNLKSGTIAISSSALPCTPLTTNHRPWISIVTIGP